jgi:predicted HTH transcriptional regulator
MTLISLILFIAGVGVGVVINRRFGAPSVASVFVAKDQDAADELRAEAAESVAQRIEKRKDRILQAARQNGRITNDDVEDLYCISDRTASKYLRQLTEAGKLTKVGGGRGTYYTPRQKKVV